MKKILLSLMVTSLLSLSASTASTPFTDEPDLAKINQYFNSLIESHLATPAISNINYPRTDIINEADKIIIKFDLAGVDKDNIKLMIDDKKVLTIRGEKKEEKEEKGKTFVRKEIFYGSFEKSIQLPQNIDENKLDTKFENGILTVTIAKKPLKEPKAKIIPIK
ncbi:MAG: Hsp20/alpha crystallin family protein [Epsilonproteobacteria bacterium]|nr:Hsp20/alpha crystallin family protein [Campylobacterota bacterium]